MYLRRVLLGLVGVLVVAGLGVPAGASAAGDVNEASCANEALVGFSALLPDCRAYELVTPPFKDGGRGLGRPLAVSVDGSHLLSSSIGAFGGTEGDPSLGGSIYELSRSGSGWETAAIDPPQTRFPAQELWAAGPDLGGSLWAMREPSQSIYALDLYRRGADGSLVKVGPLIPPALAKGLPAGSAQGIIYEFIVGYRGASSDLSHVLFKIEGGGPLWPGDTTTHANVGSLYEYVGAGNTRPALVGVNAEGHLISDCETALGSQGSRDAYNAVSQGGDTVFFTAVGERTFGSEFPCYNGATGPEVTELYARLDGVETVAISEPSVQQCAGCNTASRMPAAFQGASQDGSKVFFLTEQSLLDGATTMNLYEYDFDGVPGRQVVRVSAGSVEPRVQGVARVSEDGSHVYFVAQGALTEGANGEGREPVAGGENLYVYKRDAVYPAGHLAFVATLSEADQQDWQTADNRPVQATSDGRFLVFQSAADLTPGDTSSEQQVFEYDASREALVRVSVGASGYANGAVEADGHSSSIPTQGFGESERPTAASTGLAVSADGSQVVFSSQGALTLAAEGAAAAGAYSTYEYRSAGSIANGDVRLIAPGTSVSRAFAQGLDASGADVFFTTADSLLAPDGDTQGDLYDARVTGGFPAAGAAGCAGEACQGAPSAAAVFGAPGSVSVPGGESASPAPVSVSGPSSKSRPQARAKRLKEALRRCRRKPRRKRRSCEAQARKSYVSRANVNAKDRG
jgi:hypothetical protein